MPKLLRGHQFARDESKGIVSCQQKSESVMKPDVELSSTEGRKGCVSALSIQKKTTPSERIAPYAPQLNQEAHAIVKPNLMNPREHEPAACPRILLTQ